MKIRYAFVTGEVTEIETNDTIGEVILDIERQTYNSNQRETRRHKSLNWLEELGLEFEDNTDISEMAEKNQDIEALYQTIAKLLPQQKELLYKVFFEDKSVESIAREEGVSGQAISNRLSKIYKKFKKI